LFPWVRHEGGAWRSKVLKDWVSQKERVEGREGNKWEGDREMGKGERGGKRGKVEKEKEVGVGGE
jgi:hypothetical protein